MSKQDEIRRLSQAFITADTRDPAKASIILNYRNPSVPGMEIRYNLTHAMQTIPLYNLRAIIEQARLIYQKRVSGPIT